MMMQYSPLFFKGGHLGYWSIFGRNFRISGYDCWTYMTLSYNDLNVHFDTARHPLLLSLLYPLFQLNQWIMSGTGTNYAIIIIAVLETFCAAYSIVFIYRTFRTIIGLNIFDSYVLSVMFFSFGHVMVAMIAPDHFTLSLFMLSLTFYIAGRKIIDGEIWKWWQSALLLFFTAGISLSNGAKTLISDIFVNRKKAFNIKFILLAAILPLTLLFSIQHYQYQTIEVPLKKTTDKIANAKIKKDSIGMKKHQDIRTKWIKAHTGKPISNNHILEYTDITTSRSQSAIDNFFGESIQLHQDYLLQDMSFTRPVFIGYRYIINYIVEGIVVFLFLFSIIKGRRSQFLRMLICWLFIDITIHFILGFGLNEVYIMTTGWIFIIPISIGLMMKTLDNKKRRYISILNLLLTTYLLCWNGYLFISYLRIPMNELVK